LEVVGLVGLDGAGRPVFILNWEGKSVGHTFEHGHDFDARALIWNTKMIEKFAYLVIGDTAHIVV
jgi:hypothetical protein